MSLLSFFFSVRTRFFIGLIFVMGVASFGFGVLPARAEVDINHQITYQGKLLDAFGQPVADGTYQMKLSLYAAASGGVAVWTASGTPALPTAIPISVASGLFTVMLGDTSATGGWQNDFTGVDWNTPSIYLGVTVSPDVSEMTPRKRIGAVPQAFNAQQLQGMYASSTALSGSSLFIVNQTTNDAASSARTALEVRSSGISDANDYLIRGINNQSAEVFALNRAGSVTSTAMNLKRNGKFTALIDSVVSLSPSTSTAVGTFGGVAAFDVHGRYGYVVSNSRGFDVVDLSGLNGRGSIGNLSSPFMMKMVVSGNYAYTSDSSSMFVIDISDPKNPVVLSTTNISGGATIMDLDIQGTTLYVFCDGWLRTVDVADPVRPRLLATYSVTKIEGGDVQGPYAYLPDNMAGLIRILDIRNPNAMAAVGNYTTSLPKLTAVEGSLLVVVRDLGGSAHQLVFVDVSNPTAPVALGTYNVLRTVAKKPVIRGRYLYLSIYDSTLLRYEVDVLDIGDPTNAFRVQNYVPTANGGAITVSGNTLFTPTTNSIDAYPLAQAELTGLKASTADLSYLQVTDQSVFNGSAFFLGGITAAGGLSADHIGVSATGTRPVFTAVNTASSTVATGWGAYINTLLVGNTVTATGTANYRMVLSYDVTQGQGLCVDDSSTAKTCPSSGSASIIAEGAITGSGYDVAEHYQTLGEVLPGDVLIIDPTTSTRLTRSPGITYDTRLVGIASTDPAFVLGFDSGTAVALAGRVPTHVSTVNGPIAIGDLLTSSIYPGVAMKATAPGRIIGYALQAAETTSTIEVFVHAGYDAGSLLANEAGRATMQSDLVVAPRASVDASTRTADSWGLTFRGSAWDGTQALNSDYVLGTNIFSATSSQWSVRQASSTLFALDQSGNARLQGDLFLGGKLFPSAQGSMQTDKYIFLDNRSGSTTYMATNADGWQANDAYDFAERYYSPDALTPGDVVVVSQQGQFHVQRSFNTTLIPMGIVSTRPGFVAGMATTSTYPIALVGRVPTKVTATNGPIQIGDLLAPSAIPGVAMKATKAGPVVGQALENFSDRAVGSIEVFVHTGWWGGVDKAVEAVAKTETATTPDAEPSATPKVYQGLARISTKGQKVHIQFPTVGSYPLIQVTPYGEVDGGWWTDHYSHEGFDIILKNPQQHELTFAWRVEGMTPEQSKVPLSDGTIGDLDLDSGNLIPRDPVEEKPVVPTAPPTPEPVVTESTTTGAVTTEPVVTERPAVVPPVEPEPSVPATTEPAEIPVPLVEITPPPEVVEPAPTVTETIPTPSTTQPAEVTTASTTTSP